MENAGLKVQVTADVRPAETELERLQRILRQVTSNQRVAVKEAVHQSELRAIMTQLSSLKQDVSEQYSELSKSCDRDSSLTELGDAIREIGPQFQESLQSMPTQGLTEMYNQLNKEYDSIEEIVDEIQSIKQSLPHGEKWTMNNELERWKTELYGVGRMRNQVATELNLRKMMSDNGGESGGYGKYAIKSVIKGLVGIRSLFALVRRLVNTNETFTNSITTLFNTLGNVLEPVLTFLAKVINTISKVIAKFFGVSTKSSKSTSESATKIEKTLASFDEINKLSAPTSSSGGSGSASEDPGTLSWLEEILNWIAENFAGILAIVLMIVGCIKAVNIIEKIQAIVTFLTPVFTTLSTVVTGIASALSMSVGWLAVIVATVIAVGVLVVKNWDTIKQFFKDLPGTIKTLIGKVIDWFGDKLTKIKTWISDKVTTPISEFFSKIWNNYLKPPIQKLLNGLGKMVNGFVSMVNSVIDTINKIPGVNLGKMSKWDVPQLAQGGIAYGNSLVNVGEYTGARSNPEVIAPLDKLEEMIGKGTIHITLECDKKTLASLVYDAHNQQVIKTGRSPLLI